MVSPSLRGQIEHQTFHYQKRKPESVLWEFSSAAKTKENNNKKKIHSKEDCDLDFVRSFMRSRWIYLLDSYPGGEIQPSVNITFSYRGVVPDRPWKPSQLWLPSDFNSLWAVQTSSARSVLLLHGILTAPFHSQLKPSMEFVLPR